jgi:hypothetical protein
MSNNKAFNRSYAFAVLLLTAFLPTTLFAQEPAEPAQSARNAELSNAEIDNLVRRSYQYVAMYNVNNKFALTQGGWNTCVADTVLKDHTMRDIARPNNDTLYVGCMLDLRSEPLIVEMPDFDSDYVSMMVTAYDHYVNVPMATRLGDFNKPEKILFYSARTAGYTGEPIKGVDRIFEASGDFISVVLRIMPHSNEPERFERIAEQMQSVRMLTLAEYSGGEAKPVDDISFPPVGKTDADVYENNLLEVMQFVFNHTTFDPDNELDRAVLAAYEPLGVVPGQEFDPALTASIDGATFRAVAEGIASADLARAADPGFAKNLVSLFQPKGDMELELLVFQSVIGPIGLPAAEAIYPPIGTANGEPMNALHDYVIRMSKDQLPPALAFWSVTLYDTQNGFFIPNTQKKYSVGENAGMLLNKDGGIEIYIAAEQPAGVPAQNWLPINRADEGIGPILRIYVPDLEKMKTWQAPVAEIVLEK